MKRHILLITSIVIVMTLFTGCSKQNTIEEVLEKANVMVDKVYFTDNFKNITVAFYKEKNTKQNYVGVFSKIEERYNLLSQERLQQDLNTNEEITFNALMHDKTEEIPEFSFQFGIINNPQIETINLHMTGEPYVEDRHAEVVEIESLKIWYTHLDIKKIFNIQQGLSKEGKVIYSNSKSYD